MKDSEDEEEVSITEVEVGEEAGEELDCALLVLVKVEEEEGESREVVNDDADADDNG